MAPWVEVPWFVVFADFHGVNTPTKADFYSLDRVGKRCAQLSLKSCYEPTPAPTGGNCPGLRGHIMSLLWYSTDMPKFKRKELRLQLFMRRTLKSHRKKSLWDRTYFAAI